LTSVGPLLLAAEGPYVRFYHSQNFDLLGSQQIFEDQVIHGIVASHRNSDNVIVAIWGGIRMRLIEIENVASVQALQGCLKMSSIVRAPDWILDLNFGPTDSGDDAALAVCAAVTAHNALLEFRAIGANALGG
jgi:WD repeat-containing protein 6